MVAEAKSKERDVADAAGKLVTGINDALKGIQKDAMAKAVKEAVEAAGAAGIAAMKKAIADAKETADAASGEKITAAQMTTRIMSRGSGFRGPTAHIISPILTRAYQYAINHPELSAAESYTEFLKANPTIATGPAKSSMSIIRSMFMAGVDGMTNELDPEGTRYRIRFNGGPIPYANGGKMKYGMGGMMMYGEGGPTFGPMNMGIPATLHGGEFVIRKKAVDKYGLDMLNQMNKGIYAPKVPSLNIPMANYSKIANSGSSQQISTSESNHNYNFYVDNFIGETEWFNTMMKEYNVKVVPANQKQAGLESRVVKSYNGINRGL